MTTEQKTRSVVIGGSARHDRPRLLRAAPVRARAAGQPRQAASSPFAAGSLYALEIGARTSNNGQGNQLGEGAWQGPIDAANARAEGQARGTGFYRPEDADVDPLAAAQGGRRFCWTNTGVSNIGNFGEVLCLDDAEGDGNTGRRAVVTQFVTGNPQMNQPDNIAFQPTTGIVYVIEDTPTVAGESKPGDIWACLRDGADDDLQSDGCVRVLSVKTAGSEPTGFIFDATGKRAYVNIQHSPDNPGTPVNEGQYDEMLVVEGFQPDQATAAR
jgi:Alkaline phosphatase PhoX